VSLTRNLVEQIQAKSISTADRKQTALLILDAVASCYAGASTEVGSLFKQWADSDSPGRHHRVLLAGALTHITETDDLHRESVTHPGCAVIPVALALGAEKSSSNADVLDAVTRGFEAVCRVGMSVGPQHYKVWHNTATCGPFGAAMAAAELLDLSVEQCVWALGNAGTQSSGLWEFLEDGAMSKHLHAGRAAQSGLMAAELAAVNISGATKILEGEKGFYSALCSDPDPSRLVLDNEDSWQTHKTSIKPWPSCRHTHPAIDAAIELSKTLQGQQISDVNVESYQAALDLCDRGSPTNEYQAKFSLQHCVACALQHGEVTLDSFGSKQRSELSEQTTAVNVQVTDPFKSNYPDAWGARVTVKTAEGAVIHAERRHCKGDPELPLDAAAMQEKAVRLMQSAGMAEVECLNVCSSVLAMSDNPEASFQSTSTSLAGLSVFG